MTDNAAMDDLVPPMGHGFGADPTSWNLEEGDEIVPGRHALKKLGGGYDYEAYLAWDDELFFLVVAKCLRPHLIGDERSKKVMQREADLLLGLNHPVLVRGFSAVTEGPRPHLVMEFLEGPNLSSLLKKHGPMSMEQLLPLTMQICSALHYLATKEIVHLDVKPRNIIMGGPSRLIDMSVARSLDKARALRNPVGTDAYMSPEQCDPSSGGPGLEADAWGLGATLYHSIAGKVPFPRQNYNKDLDEDRLELRFPQLHSDPDPLPQSVPSVLQEVVFACLSKDPGARPTFSEIVAGIEPLITELPARPTLRRMRPRLRQRRSGP